MHDYLLLSKANLLKETSKNILNIVESFVYHHRRISFDSFTTSRSIKKIKSVENSTFLDDWIINKIKILEDLRRLHANTKNYRKSSEFIVFKKQLQNESFSSKTFSWDKISVQLNDIIVKSSLSFRSRQHRNHNNLSIDFELNKSLRHFRSLQITQSLSIFENMTKSDQSINHENHDNEKSSFRDVFESNTIEITKESTGQQTRWTDVSQQNWHSLQSIIQSMNFINQTIQATLQALQASMIANHFQSQSEISNTSVLIQKNNRWNAFELKFFDSLYEDKSAITDNAIEHSDKDIYFRNIHIFIERIKNIAQIKEDALMRNNLYICLRETTLTWYTSSLENDQKKLIKLENDVEEWIRVLLKKFRQSFSTAMTTVIRKKYTMNDVRRRKKSIEYAQIITRIARSAKMSMYNQIYLIYNGLDLKFRRNLSISLKFIDMNSFLFELEFKKKIWWKLKSRNKIKYNHAYSEYQRQQVSNEYSQYQESQREYSYNNRYDDEYRRQQSMSDTSENRSIRYSSQDQYNRNVNFKSENVIYNRQYSIQNSSNYRNQNISGQSISNVASGFVLQQNRTFYQYDKDKTFYQLKSTNASYDLKIQIFKSTQSFQQRQKAYYAEKDDFRYQKYSSNFSDEYEDQKNAYNEQEKEEFNEETILVQDEMSKNEFEKLSQNFFVDTSIFFNLAHQCRKCDIKCLSNNKLHKHLNECRKSIAMHEVVNTISNTSIIESNKKNEIDESCDIFLRKWHYFMIKTNIIKAVFDFFCLNTECEISMIDRIYLSKLISDYKSKIKTFTSIRIRSIEKTIVTFNEHIQLNLDILGFFNEKAAIAKIKELFHIVENLTAKILIEMNIIESKQMKIDFEKVHIRSCENLMTNLKSKSFTKSKIKKVIMCSTAITISSHINMFVSTIIREKFKILSNKNFIFNSTHDHRFDQKKDILFHIVNANFSCVNVRNITNISVFIFRRFRLKIIQEYEDEKCYFAFSKDAHLATKQWITRIKKLMIRALLTALEAAETILLNEITVYETSNVTATLKTVVEKYFTLWTDDEKIINISSKKWMSIDLKQNAKIATAKVYPLGSKEKEIIDLKFDKLHAQNKMQYSFQSTAHDYFVFVTWRTILKSKQASIKKERVVIDIRALNKIIETDIYSMSLQSDIISSVADCDFIFTVDAIAFFHQWMIKLTNRHKFIVITHRSQKQFNVDVMSFKNISSYVQRKIDNILREFKEFCRTYIDDIVIFNKILEKHVSHLQLIFELFISFNINLSSTKSFFEYLTVQLLKLKIDAFELSTSKEKLKTIANLKFSKTFQNLKIYLEFTEWFRNYVSFFAQKSELLQMRKTALLRLSFTNKKQFRKTFSRGKIIDYVIEAKKDAYKQIQQTFARSFFLFHFDNIKALYIDMNASKKWEFEIMIYHDKSNSEYSSEEYFKKIDIQLILFLSRLLTNPETKYWSTELKMIELVWVVKRTRHMIESVKKITIIFTDHVVNVSIVKQTTLSSENIDKLNFRFVRAFAYFSQFNIDVKYKANKFNTMSDVLSRLSSISFFKDFVDMNTFDIDNYHNSIENISTFNYAFQETLITMTSEFRIKLIDEYFKEKSWTKIIKMLKELRKKTSIEEIENDESVKTEIEFELHRGLIYHKKNRRLCVSASVEKKIFNLAHDQNQHSGTTRCFHRIKESIFIFRLSKKLRTYIDHCFQCQLNQTKRHKIYEKLMLIISSTISFHTMTMNFIMTISNDFDTLLIIICKFSKRLIIIAEKSTYFAKNWAIKVMNRLLTVDWDISTVIISNRNSKFLSEFWNTIFRKLEVSLLTFIVYHAQTNEQFERSNQIVEIAIRFLTSNNPDIKIVSALSTIQSQFNNSLNAFTDFSSNEVIYGFRVRDIISALNQMQDESITNKRKEYQTEASDAIAFANAKMKIYYDARHKSLLLNSGDRAFLRFNKSYKLFNHHRKLSQQKCESFFIKRRIERLVYELELSLTWRIHSIISIAQLKSALSVQDSYNRSKSDHSDAVKVDENIEHEKSYEVERILIKRIRKYERTAVTQYLIKWLDYESEFNEWKFFSALDHCLKLIEKFEQSAQWIHVIAQSTIIQFRYFHFIFKLILFSNSFYLQIHFIFILILSAIKTLIQRIRFILFLLFILNSSLLLFITQSWVCHHLTILDLRIKT